MLRMLTMYTHHRAVRSTDPGGMGPKGCHCVKFCSCSGI